MYPVLLLNARRRHRLDHPIRLTGFAAVGMCSTPGGVIVSITFNGDGKLSLVVMLLNARRRHRLDHAASGHAWFKKLLCSTPGGVIVSITWASAIRRSGFLLCSTPGGVIVSITQRPGCPPRASSVLNARRRHRLDHPTPGRPWVSDMLCSTPGGVIVSITYLFAQDGDGAV